MAGDRPQRDTQQRRVILEELQKMTSHPTASELYSIVRQRLPRISLGTVYRNLELLARTKVIRKLESAGREVRFDADLMPHDHIRCIECGNIDDLFGASNRKFEEPIIDSKGYEILGCRLDYFGLCPACRKKKSPRDES
jgi:Fur family ferric uptake transcriptional regulator